MTPKEKAIELFDKYDYILYKEYNNLEAKHCALIAVEEILEVGNVIISYNVTDYWEEVKQEIEKL
jgi:hypothetical protein